MTDSMRLAELVCVRLVHDLGGLLGSLAGVLELVRDTEQIVSEEMELATETASELVQRLRYLRVAWGGRSEDMDLVTLRDGIQWMTEARRFAVDLDGIPPHAVLTSPMARLVLNVILLAREALPRGGVLEFSGDPTDCLVARICGPGAAWPVGLAAYIQDEAHAWAALDHPRDLQAPLTALIARLEGIKLSFLLPVASGAPTGAPPLLLTPP